MIKIILISFVCLRCTLMVNATILRIPVVDTLSKRVINGLEVVPIRTTFQTGDVYWRLQISDFDKNFL